MRYVDERSALWLRQNYPIAILPKKIWKLNTDSSNFQPIRISIMLLICYWLLYFSSTQARTLHLYLPIRHCHIRFSPHTHTKIYIYIYIGINIYMYICMYVYIYIVDNNPLKTNKLHYSLLMADWTYPWKLHVI